MYKKLFLILFFLITTLNQTQFAAANYSITNSSTTETAWVVYSYHESADTNWPEGWRTRGWYEVKPGATLNLIVPADKDWVYIRVECPYRTEIRPFAHETKGSFPFWRHPSKPFIVVETTEGSFLKSNHARESLEQTKLYQYRNGGSHTITAFFTEEQARNLLRGYPKPQQTLPSADTAPVDISDFRERINNIQPPQAPVAMEPEPVVPLDVQMRHSSEASEERFWARRGGRTPTLKETLAYFVSPEVEVDPFGGITAMQKYNYGAALQKITNADESAWRALDNHEARQRVVERIGKGRSIDNAFGKPGLLNYAAGTYQELVNSGNHRYVFLVLSMIAILFLCLFLFRRKARITS